MAHYTHPRSVCSGNAEADNHTSSNWQYLYVIRVQIM